MRFEAFTKFTQQALTLNAQGHADEAFALAKTALQKNMKSPYAGTYTACCTGVRRISRRRSKPTGSPSGWTGVAANSERPCVLADSDARLPRLRRISQAMLQARPAIRQNWSALAVAYHLAGELSSAEEMLKTYEGTLTKQPPRTDLEHSEAVLYRNSLIGELGDTQRALDHLDTIYKSNLDRAAVAEARAKYLLLLERNEEAESAYRALLERNPEYRVFYESLEKCLKLDRTKPEDFPKLVELYNSLAEKNERWDAPRRIPLDYLEGDEFKSMADKYLQRMLKKGVPSTFRTSKRCTRIEPNCRPLKALSKATILLRLRRMDPRQTATRPTASSKQGYTS